MRLDEEDIRKVLALFDEKDIPYINFEYLINKSILENNDRETKSNTKVKLKKLGRMLNQENIKNR